MESKVCVGCLEPVDNTNCSCDNLFDGNYYHKECLDKLSKLKNLTKPADEAEQNSKSNQFNYFRNSLIADIKEQIAEIISSEDPASQNEQLEFLTKQLKKLQSNSTNPNKTDFIIETIQLTEPIINFGSMSKKTLVISKNGDLVWLDCDDEGNIKPIKYPEYSHADY